MQKASSQNSKPKVVLSMYQSVQNLDSGLDFNQVSLELTQSSARLSIAKHLIPYLSIQEGTPVDLLCNPREGLRLITNPRSPVALQYHPHGLVADFDYTAELDPFIDANFEVDFQDDYLGFYPAVTPTVQEAPDQALVADEEPSQAERTVERVIGSDAEQDVSQLDHEGVRQKTRRERGQLQVTFERTRRARDYPLTVLSSCRGQSSRRIGLSVTTEVFRQAGFTEDDELSSTLFPAEGAVYLKIYRGRETQNRCGITRLNPVRVRIDVPAQEQSPSLSGTQKGVPVSNSRIRDGSITVRLPYPDEAYTNGCHIVDVERVKQKATSVELPV